MNGSLLKGKARWLLFYSTYGQIVGAIGAVYYATLTLSFPQAALKVFLAVAVPVVLAAVLWGDWYIMRAMRTLRAVGEGSLPATPESLTKVARELAWVPDQLFLQGLGVWIVSSGAIGALTAYFANAGWGFAGRILLLGLLFGPLSSLLTSLSVLPRTRRVIRLLADAGLSTEGVIAALPLTRSQIRGRLAAFTAIAVLTPAAMTADVGYTLGRNSYEKVLAVSDPLLRAQLADQQWQASLASLTLVGLVVFVLAMAAAYIAGALLSQPIRKLSEEAAKIAKGELGRVRIISAEDEVWALSSAFTTLAAHLSVALGELKRAGLRIGTTAEQIIATSVRYDAGAAEQATSLNETSATTEELARSAKQISENAAAVAQLAQKTVEAALSGTQLSQAFTGAIARMRQDNQSISGAVEKLSRRVQQIGKIVEFINTVADRSDLLALSADLEGTKAGEAGRGFALVAAEMRRLAENVLESTSEIEGLIEEIREATHLAVGTTEVGLKTALAGESLAGKVAEAFKQIVDQAGNTSDAVRAISLATQQQQTGTDQLAEAMSEVLQVTQTSLTSSRQVAESNVQLGSLAKQLKDAVDRFRVA